MSRPCSLVRLESGLRLNLNNLARRGFVKPGALTGPIGIRWQFNYRDETVDGAIWADMRERSGWFRIAIRGHSQTVVLDARPRHFGGVQWYFICPVTGRRASVLWKPPGAHRFCSRHTWRRQVAYASQFLSPYHRWRHAQAKIKSRLIAKLDPDEWELPPKPKWMRWRTYNQIESKFDLLDAKAEDDLDLSILRFIRA